MADVRTGDVAPDVTLVNSDRQEVPLSSLRGRPLVLAFFPAAFSKTCTREMCTFRDDLQAFADLDAQVVGVSVDMPYSQKVWAEQMGLTFPLFSDFHRQAVKAYGVEDPKFAKGVLAGVAKRSVFVLDKDGRVAYRWVSDDPGVEPNYAEVKEAVRALQSETRA